ncbi:hypothetical protein A6R68_20786, partial [Neotoma lepida]
MAGFLLLGFSGSWEFQTARATLFLLIYVAALTGNTLIIMLTTQDVHLLTPMYFFLSNLTVSDSCYISVTVPNLFSSLLLTLSPFLSSVALKALRPPGDNQGDRSHGFHYKHCDNRLGFDHSLLCGHFPHHHVDVNQDGDRNRWNDAFSKSPGLSSPPDLVPCDQLNMSLHIVALEAQPKESDPPGPTTPQGDSKIQI